MQNSDSLSRPPSIDDRQVYDVVAGKYAFPALAMSVEIGLFETLARQPLSLQSIAEQFGLTARAAEALVSVVSAMGFLESSDDGRFRSTEVARTYLVPSSQFYRRDLANSKLPAVTQLRQALVPDTGAPEPFAVNIGALPDQERQGFMEVMHSMTLPAATALAEQPVFQKMHRLLDVAGGTGSLSLAIASRHAKIRCTVLDLAPVCEIAEKHVRGYGLSDQISVRPFDMFHDPWPRDVDGVLFGNIFHDWDFESCHLLARRSFDALEPCGTICLHEMLLNDRKDGPLTVALYSLAMLIHEKGKQFTVGELKELLTDTGFCDVRVTPTFGYYSLVTATKPPTKPDDRSYP